MSPDSHRPRIPRPLGLDAPADPTAGAELGATSANGPVVIQVIAAGCGELLDGTGYGHGQCIQGELGDALKVVGELHEHGLDVMLTHVRTSLVMVADGGSLTEHHGAMRIYVVDRNWLELGGRHPEGVTS